MLHRGKFGVRSDVIRVLPHGQVDWCSLAGDYDIALDSLEHDCIICFRIFQLWPDFLPGFQCYAEEPSWP